MVEFTFPYKRVEGKACFLDVYLPESDNNDEVKKLPVVLYFHGGGVTVGNRKSWFPNWIHSALWLSV